MAGEKFYDKDGNEITGSDKTDIIDMLSAASLLNEAEKYVIEEFEISDRQMQFFVDGDSRSIGTIEDQKTYRKALRDYVLNGVIAESKPTKPT
jgi:hypothetical protein